MHIAPHYYSIPTSFGRPLLTFSRSTIRSSLLLPTIFLAATSGTGYCCHLPPHSPPAVPNIYTIAHSVHPPHAIATRAGILQSWTRGRPGFPIRGGGYYKSVSEDESKGGDEKEWNIAARRKKERGKTNGGIRSIAQDGLEDLPAPQTW